MCSYSTGRKVIRYLICTSNTRTSTRPTNNQTVTLRLTVRSFAKRSRNRKRLQAKQVMVEIELKNAGIQFIRAQGIADASGIINKTLSNEDLQPELNLTLQCLLRPGQIHSSCRPICMPLR